MIEGKKESKRLRKFMIKNKLMLEIESFHLFIIICSSSIVSCTFIFYFNKIIRTVNLLDTKSKNSELNGFVSKIEHNFEMTFNHTPNLSLRYLTGNTNGIKIRIYGIKPPVFKNNGLRERILEKMKSDVLTQDISIKIKKQDKDFKLLCICETNTFIKRDLAYDYISEGLFFLDYNIEQEEAHLFRSYKEAESIARERKLGLWEYELVADEDEEIFEDINEKDMDIPFMPSVNEIDELDF